MFMDNDDEYALDYCEKMYDAILYYDADVVLCDYIEEDNISSYICKTNFSGDVIEKDNAIIFDKPIKNLNNMMLWNNIFRKSIIEQNNIKFPEDGLGEDCYFSYLSYMYANKVVYLNSYVGYVRHVQGSSLSRTLSFKKISEILSNLSKIVEKYNSNNYISDYNFLFNANVRLAFKYIYLSQDFKNKNDIKNILKELYVFEKKIKFNYGFSPIFRIANWLLNHKMCNLLIVYLMILRVLAKSKLLRDIYRLFN